MEYHVENLVLKIKMKHIDKGPLGGPCKKLKESVSDHTRAWREVAQTSVLLIEMEKTSKSSTITPYSLVKRTRNTKIPLYFN